MKWRFGMVGFPETLSVEMLEINSDSDGTVFLAPKDHEKMRVHHTTDVPKGTVIMILSQL